MKIVQAPRASAILYQLLIAQPNADPWILSANICPIVPLTFLKARVPFELVDIDAETLALDLADVQKKITTHHYSGLLYAHPYGNEFTPQTEFAALKALDPRMLIIDDRCLCIPTTEPEALSQTSADVTLFSTGYAKIVELNFGGYAFVKDEVRYEKVYLPFQPQALQELETAYKHAVSRRERFVYEDSDWLNTQTSLPIWANYCGEIKTQLDPALAHREAINNIYHTGLPAEMQLSTPYQTWRFNIRVRNKAQVLKALFDAGLFASSHYAALTGILDDGSARTAETLAAEVINLFNDQHIDPEQAERIVKVILETAQWS